MRSGPVIVCLVLVGTALSSSLHFVVDLPIWISLACGALGSCMAIALRPSAWPLIVLASGVGTAGGLISGFLIWPPDDPIAVPLVPYSAGIMAFAVMLAALFSALITRRRVVSGQKLRRALWALMFVCFSFGPVASTLVLAAVPSRVVRNDHLADERFHALKDSLVQTRKTNWTSPLTSGISLKLHYSGPPFADSDWQCIVGDLVEKDGYMFRVYAAGDGGYILSVSPARMYLDGTRRFCSDESGKSGCGVEWTESRLTCLPCQQQE